MDMTKPRSNLRLARAWSGLTVDAILEQTGITRTTYYRWEKGEFITDIHQAEMLARVLGVSREFLVGWRPTSEEFAELEAKGAA